MTAVLPHYKQGPANKQVSTLIFGGQLVMPTTQGYATTDLTVKLATTATVYCLGVAGSDANVVTTQTGAANAYGQPQIDISVLSDFTSVYYGGVDIPVWYSAQCYEGQLLAVSTNYGTVGPYSEQGATYSQAAGDAAMIVGRCTQPGGVATAQLTQYIGGGQGAATTNVYYLGRARIF